MRVAIIVLALLMVPASPAAACGLGEAPDLGPGIVEASEEARAVLGEQIAGYWLNDGWDIKVGDGSRLAHTYRYRHR